MNRYCIYLLLIPLTGCAVLADTSYGELIGDSAGVFIEDAVLFDAPRITSAVICSLPPGAILHRLAAIDMQYHGDGISGSWLEGSWEMDGEIIRGYIPQPWLALTEIALTDETFFLFGIVGKSEDGWNFIGSARAVRDGDILWESVFYIPGGGFGADDYRYSVSCREADPSGFTQMLDLILLSFTYEACGYENRTVLFSWTGKYLIRGPSASWIAEAGLFHYTEEFIFPEEEAPVSDHLRITKLEETFDEDIQDYVTVREDTASYLWNGLEFTTL